MKPFTIALLVLCVSSCAETSIPKPASPPPAPEKPLVVFLVRHAEKVDSSDESALTPKGESRAETLARLLRDAQIEHVHSSDFRRTRDTAAPTAKQFGLEIEYYDPPTLPALADRLREARGRHLVVGHSNTTPRLAKLLGGEPGGMIDHQEYDRLYVLTVGPNDVRTTVLLRFGE